MYATTIGVDLAKRRFELAIADNDGRIHRRQRLSRAAFHRFWAQQPPCRVVMEACGSAQHWARMLHTRGHDVEMLPAQFVRAYVRRNKTDAADAAALIEAARCGQIRPVPIKSVDQQALQQLHRFRQQLQHNRTARMNLLRGCLREFGIVLPVGMARGRSAIAAALEDADNGLPDVLRPFIADTLGEITTLQQRIIGIERTLRSLTREDPIVQALQTVPGVGLLSATALRAAVGDIQRFPSGRHFASWLGLTAREYSNGERRRLGGMTKQGDVYLRTLLTHGARSVLLAAQRAEANRRELDYLRCWALSTQRRRGTNKATVALANRLARIIWATWHHQRPFDGNWAAKRNSL